MPHHGQRCDSQPLSLISGFLANSFLTFDKNKDNPLESKPINLGMLWKKQLANLGVIRLLLIGYILN